MKVKLNLLILIGIVGIMIIYPPKSTIANVQSTYSTSEHDSVKAILKSREKFVITSAKSVEQQQRIIRVQNQYYDKIINQSK